MNRRSYLKSLAGTPLLPSLPAPNEDTDFHVKYLDWLFSGYTSIITSNKSYSVTEVGESRGRSYNIGYSSYKNSREMTVWYISDDFVRYNYTPQSDYEAYQLYELVRNSGLDAVISEIKGRGLKSSKQIKNYREKQ